MGYFYCLSESEYPMYREITVVHWFALKLHFSAHYKWGFYIDKLYVVGAFGVHVRALWNVVFFQPHDFDVLSEMLKYFEQVTSHNANGLRPDLQGKQYKPVDSSICTF